MNSLNPIKKTLRTWFNTGSSQISKPSSKRLFGYDDILLKDFIAICGDGDISRLVVSGSFDPEEIVDAWEKIIERNSQEDGDQRFESYKRLHKIYADMLAEHTIVSACLMIMTIQDAALCWEEVTEVVERGYHIDTSTGERYIQSILAAKRKVSHLMTNCERKRKEIERRFGKRDRKEAKSSVYEIVGGLEVVLGFGIPNIESLTLAHYNALKKGAKEREAIKAKSNKSKSGRTAISNPKTDD